MYFIYRQTNLIIAIFGFFFLTLPNNKIAAQCDPSGIDLPGNGIDNDCDGLDDLYLFMPAYYYLAEGVPFDLFFRNIFLSKHVPDYRFAVLTDVQGTVSAEKWAFTPSLADVGEYPLTVQIKDATGKILATASSVMRIAAAQTPANVGPKKLIVLGHSLIDQGIMPYYLRQLTDGPGNPTITHHGTRISWSDFLTHHEGKGGASWQFFAHDASSPLVFNGQLDLRHYFNDVICANCNPDYFVIQLDINDFCVTALNNGYTIQSINDFIDKVYAADIVPLIAALRSTAPNAKIGICLTPPANDRPNVFLNHFGPTSILGDTFRWKKIVNAIYAKYTDYFEGRQSENIYLLPIHAGVDNLNHYDDIDPFHPFPANSPLTVANGYVPISRGIYGWIKNMMALGTCNLNVAVKDLQCNSNNTFTNGSDDNFTYSLLVNGANAGTGWQATLNGQSVSGIYGTPKTMAAVAANGTPLNFDVKAQNNAACKALVAVSAASCSNGVPVKVDLQMSVTTDNPLPTLFNTFKVTFKVTNNSANAAEGVWVSLPKAPEVAFPNSNPYTASQGTYDWFYSFLWDVGKIPANGTASLTVDYYLLQSTPFTVYSQVYAAVQTDTDSKPANGNGLAALEDDEGTLTFGQPCSPDQTPPILTGCPANISVSTTGTGSVVNWTAPVATDVCTGSPTLTSSHVQGTNFPIGTATVTYTAKDAANNTTTCAFTVNVTQQITGTCGNNLLQNAGFESGLVNWAGTGGAVGTDAASGTKSLQMCTAGTAMRQTVAAQPTKNYQLLWKSKTAGTNQNIYAEIKFLSSTWQVLGSEGGPYNSPGVYGSGTLQKTAPTGTAWVEIAFYKQNTGCIFVDDVCLSEGGSTNTDPCAPDVTPPVLLACPANISLTTNGASATATWTPPNATDNCVGSIALSSTQTSGASFPVGSTNVTYTAWDVANNTASCTFIVTVTSSVIQPSVCTAVSDFPWEDWISSVKINSTDKTSGKSTYSNVTSAPFALSKTTANTIALTTSWSYFTFDQYFRVWIDYNQDNIFQSTEKVFEGIINRPADGTPSKTLAGSISVPSTALTGNAKMRVIMRRSGYAASACGNIPFGEVEDFVVNITQQLLAGTSREQTNPLNLQDLDAPEGLLLFPNPAGDAVQLYIKSTADLQNMSGFGYLLNQLGKPVQQFSLAGLKDGSLTLDLSALDNGVYFVQVSIPGRRKMLQKLIVSRMY